MGSSSCQEGIGIAFDGPRQRRHRLRGAFNFAQRIARVAAQALIGLIALDGGSGLRQHLARLFDQTWQIAAGVTHDQTEAMAIADRVAVMSHGSIAQIGTPEALYRAPASPFVARFVGDAMPLAGRAHGGALHLDGGVLPLDVADGGTAYVRAEDVKLDEDGPLTGRIETVTFLGTHYRIVLSGITPDPLALLHVGASAPKVGQAVRLSIAPGAILTFAPGLEDA